MFRQRHFEEIERHVDVIGPKSQLFGQRHNLPPGVLQRDLPGLPADAGGERPADRLSSLGVRGDERSDGRGAAVCILLKLDIYRKKIYCNKKKCMKSVFDNIVEF